MRKNVKVKDLVVDRFINLELFKASQEPQPNGCIHWTGVKNNVGYGFIGFKRIDENGEPEQYSTRMMTTHRLAFMIKHNRLPTKRNVNHTCHNKLCLNPDHLEEGTQRDKLNDMKRDGIKGGGKKGVKRGPYNHKQDRPYKFTEAEIQWVRSADTEDIAKKYNISITTASRKQWGFRVGYTWLPAPCKYEPRKRGPKFKTAK
jgi:hypothetical protein